MEKEKNKVNQQTKKVTNNVVVLHCGVPYGMVAFEHVWGPLGGLLDHKNDGEMHQSGCLRGRTVLANDWHDAGGQSFEIGLHESMLHRRRKHKGLSDPDGLETGPNIDFTNKDHTARAMEWKSSKRNDCVFSGGFDTPRRRGQWLAGFQNSSRRTSRCTKYGGFQTILLAALLISSMGSLEAKVEERVPAGQTRCVPHGTFIAEVVWSRIHLSVDLAHENEQIENWNDLVTMNIERFPKHQREKLDEWRSFEYEDLKEIHGKMEYMLAINDRQSRGVLWEVLKETVHGIGSLVGFYKQNKMKKSLKNLQMNVKDLQLNLNLTKEAQVVNTARVLNLRRSIMRIHQEVKNEEELVELKENMAMGFMELRKRLLNAKAILEESLHGRILASSIDRNTWENAVKDLKEKGIQKNLEPLWKTPIDLFMNEVVVTKEDGGFSVIIPCPMKRKDESTMVIYKLVTWPIIVEGKVFIIDEMVNEFAIDAAESLIVPIGPDENCYAVGSYVTCPQSLENKVFRKTCIGSLFANEMSSAIQHCNFKEIKKPTTKILEPNVLLVYLEESEIAKTICGSETKAIMIAGPRILEVSAGCEIKSRSFNFRPEGQAPSVQISKRLWNKTEMATKVKEVPQWHFLMEPIEDEEKKDDGKVFITEPQGQWLSVSALVTAILSVMILLCVLGLIYRRFQKERLAVNQPNIQSTNE